MRSTPFEHGRTRLTFRICSASLALLLALILWLLLPDPVQAEGQIDVPPDLQRYVSQWGDDTTGRIVVRTGGVKFGLVYFEIPEGIWNATLRFYVSGPVEEKPPLGIEVRGVWRLNWGTSTTWQGIKDWEELYGPWQVPWSDGYYIVLGHADAKVKTPYWCNVPGWCEIPVNGEVYYQQQSGQSTGFSIVPLRQSASTEYRLGGQWGGDPLIFLRLEPV